MRARHSVVALAACAAIAAAGCAPQAEAPADSLKAAPPTMKMTTEIPASVSTPDELDTSIGTLEFFDGVPTQDTVETAYDFLDKVHGMKAFLSMLPSMSVYELREGQRSVGARESHQICIFDTLMDSTTVLLTGNTSTMYAIGFLDLATDGPVVIDLPTGMLGVLDDMAFRYMTDLGVAGPDKGKGGKFLVLPPGYDGDVPDGYFVVPSKTSGVWVFMRGYLDHVRPGLPRPEEGRPDGDRASARNAGSAQRHGLPVHGEPGCRGAGQGQGRQVPGASSRIQGCRA